MRRSLQFLLTITILLLANSCLDEENTTTESFALEKTETIQTASVEEINDFLTIFERKTTTTFRSITTNETIIDYYPILNTKAEAGVLKRFTDAQSSYYVFFKKEGELIKNRVSVVPDSVYKNWETFSGTVLVSELSGSRWTRYEYKDGFLERAILGDRSLVAESISFRSLTGYRSETCCEGYIEEVVFTVRRRIRGGIVPITNLEFGGENREGIRPGPITTMQLPPIGGGGYGPPKPPKKEFKYANNLYKKLYPNFTKLLKHRISILTKNPKIVNAIKKYTSLTESQIKHHLKWGNGPTIEIKHLNNAYGEFNSKTPNTLYIDEGFVELFETTNNPFDFISLDFVLTVTILHEYVHFGDNLDGIDFPGEEGAQFEIDAFGKIIWFKKSPL